jgi:2,4-dienoyl-CoA reductase-like NADH-dependent reductase (Old Yellow Enzyme family)
MPFKEFNYGNAEQIVEEARSLGLDIPFSPSVDILKKKVNIDGFTVSNSLAIHPMEGCDGNGDGSPGELTARRYKRFAGGGAGLIWFEAVAVVPEGRANPRQLWINSGNLREFRRIADLIKKTAASRYGEGFVPLFIMQLTHSGRYSKPFGKPAPVIACHNPYLDTSQKIDESILEISDEQLESLEDEYVKAALLAQEAGFHGVDIKSCHRYLVSELLSGFTRKGRYGETFEGRTRFLLNVTEKIKSSIGKGFIVTTRMNIFDGIPHPYGFGVNRENTARYDLTEPKKLVKMLFDKGMRLINLTMGNPYYNPHINRPYNKGAYIPEEHPLEGVARMINGAGEVQRMIPDIAVVGTGYSWLREFAPYIATGALCR